MVDIAARVPTHVPGARPERRSVRVVRPASRRRARPAPRTRDSSGSGPSSWMAGWRPQPRPSRRGHRRSETRVPPAAEARRDSLVSGEDRTEPMTATCDLPQPIRRRHRPRGRATHRCARRLRGPGPGGRNNDLRLSRWHGPSDLQRPSRVPASPHPRSPRAGWGPRRRRVQPGNEGRRGRNRDVGSWGDQPRHRLGDGDDGFGADGCDHRERPARPSRQGRLPGDRYRRDRAARHKVRDRGDGSRRGPACDRGGLRDRALRAARARSCSTSRRMCSRPRRVPRTPEQRHELRLADCCDRTAATSPRPTTWPR